MGWRMGRGWGRRQLWKSEEKRVMIRALDFTPQPDNSYRYRVRIVVFNPNHNRDDVINTASTPSPPSSSAPGASPPMRSTCPPTCPPTP